MSEVGANQVPGREELFNPTLYAIRALGGSARVQEIAQRVAQDMNLSDSCVQWPHGNGRITELEYRLYWARNYLKQYGLIDNSTRGVWTFTSTGLGTNSVDPTDVVRYVRGVRTKGNAGSGQDIGDMEEGESSDTDSWRETLAEVLREMPPDAFERLCQRVLRESGFIEVEVTGKSGDGGIDGKGIIRFGGLISFPVIFQCKRYSSNVGPAVVRELRGSMQGRADRGMILTTSGFTADAHKEATRDGVPPIDLIDGDLLLNKLKEFRLGVDVQMVEDVTVDASWFQAL